MAPLDGLTAPPIDMTGSYADTLVAGYGKLGETAQSEDGTSRTGRHVTAPSLILQEGYVPLVDMKACQKQTAARIAEYGLQDDMAGVAIDPVVRGLVSVVHGDRWTQSRRVDGCRAVWFVCGGRSVRRVLHPHTH